MLFLAYFQYVGLCETGYSWAIIRLKYNISGARIQTGGVIGPIFNSLLKD